MITCIYCGEFSNTLDHVLPLSFAAQSNLKHFSKKRFPQAFCVVPSCAECNRLAADKVFFWIKEKRKYIQKKIEQKNQRFLRTVHWDDDEISELGYNLRNEVMNAKAKRYRLECRVYYPAMKQKAGERIKKAREMQ